MQSFREHCRDITEALDKPYPYRVVKSNANVFEAAFDIPAGRATPKPLSYSVHFAKHTEHDIPLADNRGRLIEPRWVSTEKPWEFTFALVRTRGSGDPGDPKTDTDTYGVSRTGHAFSVFATVIAVMKEFIAKHRPAIIYFTATESSRAKLYDRFMKGVPRAVSGYLGHKLTGQSRRNAPHNLADWVGPGNYVVARRNIPINVILGVTAE